MRSKQAAAAAPSIDARRLYGSEFDRRGGVSSTSHSRQSTRLSCVQPLLVRRESGRCKSSFENASLRALDPERGKRERADKKKQAAARAPSPPPVWRLQGNRKPPRCPKAIQEAKTFRKARSERRASSRKSDSRGREGVPFDVVGGPRSTPATKEEGEHALSLPLACSRAFSSLALLLIILTEGTRPLALLAHCVWFRRKKKKRRKGKS